MEPILTQAKLTAIQSWKEQPTQSYTMLQTSTPAAMIKADTPNLWEIRSNTNHAVAVAILVKALLHLARLVNVERNLNEVQIGEIAGDVIEEYGYLKVEEVKYILKRAAKAEKIFGRLDYNVVMGWFEQYATERVTLCVDISNQESTEEQNAPLVSADATMSYGEYMEQLEIKAKNGDKEAEAKIAAMSIDTTDKPETPDNIRQKEITFRQWYHQYINQKR